MIAFIRLQNRLFAILLKVEKEYVIKLLHI